MASSAETTDSNGGLMIDVPDSLHQLLRMSREEEVVGPFVVSLDYSFGKKRRTLTHELKRSVSTSLYSQ
ncbi:hypothetical protein QQ045_015317 [Rhodiola kirilowii]